MTSRYLIASTAALAVLVVGCTSIKSTLLKRNPDNSFVGNSNGMPCKHGQARPFKGVPITVAVPTHVDIEIVETYYLELVEATGAAKLHEVAAYADEPRNLDVVATPVFTKKVFTVDFVRPAAGTLDTDMKFDKDRQAFTSIQNKIVDKTIQDITTAIGTLTPILGKKTTAAIGKDIGPRVLANTRTVAFERFNIDDPNFLERVNGFVNLHLNSCNDCQGRVLRAGDEGIEQLPTPPTRGGDTFVPGASRARVGQGTRPNPIDSARRVVVATDEYVVYAN